VYKKNILTAKLESNPYTFLHVINPEFRKDNKTKPNSIERFEKVKEKFDEFRKNGVFIQDKKDCLYLYRQITPQNTYIGIIAGISVDDYLNGTIKIHEHTLTQREETFKMYLDVCQFNAEPVLLTYKDNPIIESIINKYLSKRSEYEFCTTHLIKQDLWLIDNVEDIKILTSAFEHVNEIYIADGHHRSSSSVLYAKTRREVNPNYNPNDKFNYFLAYFIAESKLNIVEYNRVVNHINGLTEDEFLNKLSTSFDIELKKSSFKPTQIHHFSMYLNKKWYLLKTKEELISNKNIIQNLDTKILSDHVLNPILNIKDLKTDDSIFFIEGTKGVEGLKKVVDSGKAKVAFGLFPVSIEQLKAVADANEIMPPKSTWIEPKMRSGLTIYDLK
ncbi:MAG: DUF1015 domain-containing protein, partial [Flavobacteriales bacterium]|nr:DUF1015 domain-containing protein [Flavobacteriales bacterium]